MFSLVADYSDTSSSSDEDDSSDEGQQLHGLQKNQSETTPPPTTKALLPSANLLLNPTGKSTGVVFNNPFLEAEKAEIDKLQKHVKMVESEEHLIQKNGRKICWNNRKGRCRFGNKCKYAHDSDLVAADSAEEVNEAKEDVKHLPPPPNAIVVKTPQLSHHHQLDTLSEYAESKLKSRKRPGLGDSIVPGKKVMKQYQTTKSKTAS